MIQINNLSARLDAYNSKITAAVKRVIDSGWLVLGPEVKRFEKDFSSYLDTKWNRRY
jgi:dTDP-4-amino-4,6-dideoxygalactose transaminase